jgi:hypothetical protein
VAFESEKYNSTNPFEKFPHIYNSHLLKKIQHHFVIRAEGVSTFYSLIFSQQYLIE